MGEMEASGADRLVPQKEAAKILGMGLSTLRRTREVPYVEIRGRTGGRMIRRYRLSSLYKFIEDHTVDPMKRAS